MDLSDVAFPLPSHERGLNGTLAATSTTTAEASGCKHCAERNTPWKNSLTSNGHGCSACKNVLDASSWSREMVRAHRRFDRDLVCPSCAEQGYAPGQYDEHQCEECLEKFGSLRFDKHLLLAVKKRKKSRLVCRDCQKKLRCAKCNTAYELEYWSKRERTKHFSSQQTKLICTACREQGFHPHDLETYQCEECLKKFGGLKFPGNVLAGVKKRKKPRLECRDCQSRYSTANEVRQTQVLKANTAHREETKEAPLDVPRLSDELRCRKCNTAHELRYWSGTERQISTQRTKLVCKACRAQGFHPGDLETYTCETCACDFGALKFKPIHLQYFKVRRKKKFQRLLCTQCAVGDKRMLQCAKCKRAYELKYWSKSALDNHSSSRRTKLVCRACRAQGFRSGDLETYTCQTCACEFGTNEFNQIQLHHFKYHRRKKLQCRQCDAAAKNECNSHASSCKRATGNARAIAACTSKSAPLLQ